MKLACLLLWTLWANPLSLRNGAFRERAGDLAAGWEPFQSYRLLPTGGPGGSPAILAECDGGGSSGAVQVLQLSPARRGAFAVTARMRCEEVGGGGDCSLWLDVLQEGGPPLWGVQGLPDRARTGWQEVRAEVRPTHPVREVRVHLLLRNVRGRVRFADVRLVPLPLTIRALRAYPSAGGIHVRGAVSESAAWRLEVRQGGRVTATASGEGVDVRERLPAAAADDADVTLRAELNGQSAEKRVRLSGQTRAPALAWWVAGPTERVFQDDLPPERPLQQAALDEARNDRESFQVCLRSARPFSGARVRISDLAGPAGRIPASRVEWFRVGYVRVEQPFAHPFAPRRTAAWWPDPLLAGVPFDCAADRVQPLWFTVHVPPEAAPGEYRGTVTVSASGTATVRVPLSVRVHACAIPDRGSIKTAFALMDGYLRKLYGDVPRPLRRAYTGYLLAHHLNPDDISRTAPPDLDELSYAAEHGLNAFNVLNVVPEAGPGVTWVCFAPLSDYTPAFRKRFFERLDAIVPQLERRGLLDRAYVYGFDERGPEYIPVIRDLFGEVKRRYPRLHTLSTCWPPAGTDPLSLNVDWFVPLSSSYDPETAASVRRRGGEMWWYICMGPNYPYANWLLENPLVEARLIWWQVVQNGVEGFLYWGLNIWERGHNDRPIADDAGPCLDWSVTTGGDYAWLNGDGELLYPGPRGPIGSLRMESIRDGLEDAEVLRQYGERFGRPTLDRLLARVTTDRTHYTRDAEVLMRARAEALRRLDRAGTR